MDDSPYDLPVDFPPPGPPVEAVEVHAAAKRPHQPHIGWALLWTALIFIAQLGVGIVVGIAIFAVSAVAGELVMESPWWPLLFAGCATLTTILLAVAVVGWLYGRRSLHLMSLRGCGAGQWLVALLYLLPLAIVGSEVSIWAAEFLPSLNLDMFEELVRAPAMAVFIAVCLFPGIGEELYFRGFLSRGLIASHGMILGTLFASALFALMHVDPVQICGTFVIGFGLQLVFVATRSLLSVMVVHTLNNAIAFALLALGDRYYIPGVTKLEEAEAGWTAFVHTPLPIFLAACAALALLSVCLYQMRTRWLLPDGTFWTPPYPTTESPPPELHARAEYSRPGLVLALATLASYLFFISSLALALTVA